jgi:hypothetical protein
MTQHFLLGEVAKILACRPHQIDYQLKTRQVPKPETRIANKESRQNNLSKMRLPIGSMS